VCSVGNSGSGGGAEAKAKDAAKALFFAKVESCSGKWLKSERRRFVRKTDNTADLEALYLLLLAMLLASSCNRYYE
jgi:hypothetical protein